MNHQPGARSVGYKSYLFGFVFSLALTIEAYLFVTQHILSGWTLGVVLAGFALTQLFVQLYFFLHLGNEPKPRWNLLAFGCMALVVLILVAGTIWIMINLSYQHGHTMSPDELKQYLHTHEGL